MQATKRLLLLGAVLAGTVRAEALNYNLISLDAEVQREIPNDEMRAMMFAEHGDADATKLASLINRQLNEAKKVASRYPSIRFSSGDNQTYPVYDNKNRFTGWRSRAEVRLECNDFRLCSELIGKLQGTLQLASWDFGIAQATRQKVENELMAEAVEAFKAKAELVSRALKAPGYKLVNLNFSSRTPVMPRFAMAKAEMAMAAPPVVEAGSGNVSVAVNGAVQMLE